MNPLIRKLSPVAICLILAAFLVFAGPVQAALPAITTSTAITTATTAATSAITAAASTNTAATFLSSTSKTYTVSLDVNPSIEFVVTDGLVTDVNAFNDDGAAIMLAVDVVGKTAEEAVRLCVAAMINEGYIAAGEDEPYLIVTVSNGDRLVVEDAAELLEKAAEGVLGLQNIECKIRSAYVPDSVAAEAAALNLSTGRYIVIKVVAEKEGLTIEEAIALYGSTKINVLMKSFPEAKDAFKDYNKSMELADDENEAEDDTGMTPEQKALFQAARDTFHQEINAANAAFFLARDTLKANLKSDLEALEKPKGKDSKEGKDAYNEAVKTLRDAAKVSSHEAIDTMKAAIKAAQAKFRAAKVALGIIGAADEIVDEAADIEESDSDIDELIDDLVDDDDNDNDDDDNDENRKDKVDKAEKVIKEKQNKGNPKSGK